MNWFNKGSADGSERWPKNLENRDVAMVHKEVTATYRKAHDALRQLLGSFGINEGVAKCYSRPIDEMQQRQVLITHGMSHEAAYGVYRVYVNDTITGSSIPGLAPDRLHMTTYVVDTQKPVCIAKTDAWAHIKTDKDGSEVWAPDNPQQGGGFIEIEGNIISIAAAGNYIEPKLSRIPNLAATAVMHMHDATIDAARLQATLQIAKPQYEDTDAIIFID